MLTWDFFFPLQCLCKLFQFCSCTIWSFPSKLEKLSRKITPLGLHLQTHNLTYFHLNGLMHAYEHKTDFFSNQKRKLCLIKYLRSNLSCHQQKHLLTVLISLNVLWKHFEKGIVKDYRPNGWQNRNSIRILFSAEERNTFWGLPQAVPTENNAIFSSNNSEGECGTHRLIRNMFWSSWWEQGGYFSVRSIWLQMANNFFLCKSYCFDPAGCQTSCWSPTENDISFCPLKGSWEHCQSSLSSQPQRLHFYREKKESGK